MSNATADPGGSSKVPAWLWAVVVIALAAGLYGRFKGLGLWALGVDEFYILRSIDNLLQSGVPEFACGGFYTRGLLYQYVVALLRLAGLGPEFAGRVVTAASSLLVLPAAYLLGRRLHGKTVGLLVVAILSISVWEIEIARFARMYAPFQAVFAWYLWFFLRYVIDRDRRALLPMVLLSILGVLTWEGGALVGLLNLLPPFINHERGRLRRGDWLYLAGMALLFVLLYASTADLRELSAIPALPETTAQVDTEQYTDTETVSVASLPVELLQHLGWIVAALIPLCFAAISLKWTWSLRDRWLAASGLGVTLVAALLGQFLVCLSVLTLLLLSQLISWRELCERRALPFLLAIGISGIFWLAFGWLTGGESSPGLGTISKLAVLVRQLGGFPDLIDQIALPWARAVPLLGVVLFIALAALTWKGIVRGPGSPTAISVLLVVVLILGLVISAADTPRFETRYTYFLYPLLVTLGMIALASLADTLRIVEKRKANLVAFAGLGLFALTEDFQPRHIATIDSQATNFRAGMKPSVSSHYYPRGDVGAIADWLAGQVRPGDLVLNGIPSVDQYYAKIDYVFLDDEDYRYESYACQRGTVDRWSNRPLLHGTDALVPLVASGRKIFIVLYRTTTPRVAEAFEEHGWQFTQETPALYGGADVLILNPG